MLDVSNSEYGRSSILCDILKSIVPTERPNKSRRKVARRRSTDFISHVTGTWQKERRVLGACTNLCAKPAYVAIRGKSRLRTRHDANEVSDPETLHGRDGPLDKTSCASQPTTAEHGIDVPRANSLQSFDIIRFQAFLTSDSPRPISRKQRKLLSLWNGEISKSSAIPSSACTTTLALKNNFILISHLLEKNLEILFSIGQLKRNIWISVVFDRKLKMGKLSWKVQDKLQKRIHFKRSIVSIKSDAYISANFE